MSAKKRKQNNFVYEKLYLKILFFDCILDKKIALILAFER